MMLSYVMFHNYLQDYLYNACDYNAYIILIADYF